MDFLIIDLEGTCCDNRKGGVDKTIPTTETETIEIGAVIANLDGKITHEFSQLVRPVRHPVLTEFCTALTGITQADVDGAKTFSEVWPSFLEWVRQRYERYSFCSWGRYDLDQLRKDCYHHGVRLGFNSLELGFNSHCDLCKAFGRRVGNRKAAHLLGIEPQGTHHRGLDDARNIAAVLAAMSKSGRRIRSCLL